MYKSPIELIYGEIQTRTDGEILQAVRSVGVSVDKDELTRALAYDRDQYQKGFWEGVESARRWISVEERLPDENHDWVLVICRFVPEGGYGVPHVAELRGGVWYADCYDGPIEEGGVKVTHWMPLPEPPAATLNQGQEL